jgi:hypothetical protein
LLIADDAKVQHPGSYMGPFPDVSIIANRDLPFCNSREAAADEENPPQSTVAASRL